MVVYAQSNIMSFLYNIKFYYMESTSTKRAANVNNILLALDLSGAEVDPTGDIVGDGVSDG